MKASAVVRLALQRNGIAQRTLAQQPKNYPLFEAVSHFHAIAGHFWRDQDEQEKRRVSAMPLVSPYHTSAPAESGVAIVLGLGAVSAASFAAAQGVKAYREWQASQPETPPPAPEGEADSQHYEEEKEEEQQQQSQQQAEGPRENIFKKWFDISTTYYEGGFEEKMTRREAALILGVRESSSAKRIKEAHRKLLILNHPDTGGSTYMAGKINEAKELLLKGKDR